MADAAHLHFWTELLDLPGFVVVHHDESWQPSSHHRHNLGRIRPSPHCAKPTELIKQRRTRERIRDLPIGTHAVELTIRVSQFHCESCGQFFTSPIPLLADGSHATERLLRRVADLVQHSDVANAARYFAIPEKNLERWYYDYLERHQPGVQTPLTPIRRIGIDELSLKNGTASSSP